MLLTCRSCTSARVVDGVEAVGEHGRRARPRDLPEPGVQAVDVEQRQDQQHHVVRRDDRRLDPAQLLEVREQCPMREHGAARPAGGARGVEQDREVLATDRLALDGPALAGREQVVPRVGSAADHDDLVGRQARRATAACSTSVTTSDGPRVEDLVVELGRGVGGVERDGDQAGPQDAEVGDDEPDGVRQQDADPRAALGRPAPAGPPRRGRPRASSSAQVTVVSPCDAGRACPGARLLRP